MKKHAIIPIFISHRGCPKDCVFCNQRQITARNGDVSVHMAKATIEQWLTTLQDVPTKEISFYGGSFTGIPVDEQEAFLSLAKSYKDSGRVDKIHLSTRPDYIDSITLDRLKLYGVDVIELGVQSFDREVLKLSKRGHSAECITKSCRLIKSYGFKLGIQLMVGLPGDTMEKCIFSALETVKINPEIARIYPTVVIRDTELYDLYEKGQYIPLTLDEAVKRSKAIYEILDSHGINIIRVGLKSGDGINGEMGFHPAFRQLVEDEIAKEQIEKQIDDVVSFTDETTKGGVFVNRVNTNKIDVKNSPPLPCATIVTIIANSRCYNNIFGHKGKNMEYFKKKYPRFVFETFKDHDQGLKLKDNEYKVKIIFK